MPSLVAREVGNEITGRRARAVVAIALVAVSTVLAACSAPATHQASSAPTTSGDQALLTSLRADRLVCASSSPSSCPLSGISISYLSTLAKQACAQLSKDVAVVVAEGLAPSNAANIWQAELNAFYNYGPGSAQALTGSPRLTTRVTGMTGYDYMALVRVAVSVDCPQFNAYAPDVPATSSTTIAPAPTTTTPPASPSTTAAQPAGTGPGVLSDGLPPLACSVENFHAALAQSDLVDHTLVFTITNPRCSGVWGVAETSNPEVGDAPALFQVAVGNYQVPSWVMTDIGQVCSARDGIPRSVEAALGATDNCGPD